MQVLIETRDIAATDVKETAEKRVRFAIRRLAWLVPRARVQLSDINGPRGGVDKRCQIELKTDGNGVVVVTAVARDWRTALDSAIARAARVLVRSVRRSKKPQQRTLHTQSMATAL